MNSDSDLNQPIPIKKINGVKYIPFMNKEPLTPFTAFWRYSIGERIASRIDCNRLGKFLLSKKEEVLSIKDKLQDGGTGLGPNSTTARWASYNVLNWRWESEDVKILEEEIIKTHDLYYTQMLGEKPPMITVLACWMNIMKKKMNAKDDHKHYVVCYLEHPSRIHQVFSILKDHRPHFSLKPPIYNGLSPNLYTRGFLLAMEMYGYRENFVHPIGC